MRNTDQAMSYLSLGDSVYYRTSISYTRDAMSAQMPLPYPPEQVWCAVLERSPAERGVVYVALHQDIHHADWLVHEAAEDVFSDQSFEVAATIGCRLGP